MKPISRFLLMAALMASFAPAAHAERPDFDNDHSRGRGHHDERMDDRGRDEDRRGPPHDRMIIFPDERRVDIQNYMRDHYRGHCPPGLAKKHNGCYPPGQAKRYVIGERLPRYYTRPPQRLITIMGPPPQGTYYAMVDKDVLLVSEATKKILDAITLLSAVE